MIRIINLTKKFGNFIAIDNLNIEIGKGKIFGFLGPNGAGKTTTVKIISGILKPTSGKIYVNDIDILKDPIKAKKIISYIPDEPFVYPYLTAREFLKFIAEVYNLKEYNAKIDELLDFFGLLNDADKLLNSYSHGMKQKLLIASVLLRNSEVILFDEPTVGLDPISVKKFKSLMKKLTSEGKIIFMCTHILEMAQKICDEIAVINEGKIIIKGSVNEILTKFNDTSLEDVFFKLTT